MARETLREKAARELGTAGPGANPSQLGDPISMKNETTGRDPAESEEGAAAAAGGVGGGGGQGEGHNSSNDGGGGKNTNLRSLAASKLHGPGANPSLLGDPVSLKNETSARDPTGSEAGGGGGGGGQGQGQGQGLGGRDSKL